LIDEIIDLRNRIHKDDFRFVLTPEHWKAVYAPENTNKSNLVTTKKDGRLKGYAVFGLVNFEQIRAYEVREICAEDEDTEGQLIDQIVNQSVQDNVDFVFVKRCEEPYESVFTKKGFASFVESAVMITLFDPRQLLLTLSERIEKGKVLAMQIAGFDPIIVKVGQNGIMVMDDGEPDLTVSTDSKTFLRLFFGRTSFLKEFLRKRISVSSILSLTVVNRFFKAVRHDKWYIPMGDWV